MRCALRINEVQVIETQKQGCTRDALHPVAGGSKLCPHQCSCHGASELVDCRSRGFTHIPHSIPHGTWLLDLSGNKLSEFLSRIGLKLSHNTLEHLETKSLEDLESLERLDLSHNHIRVIEVGAFRGLTILRHLNLAWNQLTVLQGGLLSMQQGLGVLLLGHNNISKIEVEALAPLQTLTILNLEANQLRSLKFKIFLNLKTPSTHLQMSENPWTCDCDLHRVFSKILRVRHLHVDDYVNITCHSPLLLAGASLGLMHSQLCIAETATVLIITGTVMVTVVAAMVMAERKRKKKRMNLENQ
ncbi:unnamed protein product [Leuciscus chuanchicus]